MTVIDAKEAARILNVKESWIRDRCKPGCPKAEQIPHFRMPGSRLIRFHAEILQAWADAGCPPATEFKPSQVWESAKSASQEMRQQ